MKYVFFILLCSIQIYAQKMQTKVIAHRGAWKEFNLPQNSIASLKKAIELKCYGSEFDVHMTKDNIPVVNHDHDFYGVDIETSNYNDLLSIKHSNNEVLPTLADYFDNGLNQNYTKLILEIKTSKVGGVERTKQLVEVIINKLPKNANPENLEFILFDFESSVHLKRLLPMYKVHYLEGDKSAKEISESGLNGMDYHFKILLKDTTIVPTFKELGLKTNAWTVNDLDVAKQLNKQGIDYLTTDMPDLFLKEKL